MSLWAVFFQAKERRQQAVSGRGARNLTRGCDLDVSREDRYLRELQFFKKHEYKRGS